MRLFKIMSTKYSILHLIYVLSLCFQVIFVSGSRFVCIGHDKKERYKLCTSQGDVNCNVSSLSMVPQVLHEHRKPYYVQFCTTNIDLEEHIQFNKLYNVTFIGDQYKTIINCTSKAGMSFSESEGIQLENLIFDHCGAEHDSTSVNVTSKNSTLRFYSSIYAYNSTNFSMNNVTIRNSNGLGLTLFDVNGLVNINSCVFENNGVAQNADHIPGGGGVYVEFTYCPPGRYDDSCDQHSDTSKTTNSTYRISNSDFTNNTASQVMHTKTDFYVNEHEKFQGLGRGGGVQVIFRGKSSGNNVTLYNCSFYNNKAVWGGGLKASFQDESSQNSLVVVKSAFQQNTCVRNGGGGADVGYTFYNRPFPYQNNIIFSDCTFIKNEAKFGGGLAFYSSDSPSSELNNTVEFENCVWKANKARFGSALSISIHAWTTILNGNLPTPVFKNTKFVDNAIVDKLYSKDVYESFSKGTGAFFATRYTLFFYESLEFKNNNGSAMYLTSSVMKIAPNTKVSFVDNSGFNGGAIALIAFSVIVLGDNSSLFLKTNTAVRCGGAIYSYSIDQHDYLSSRTCFIQNNSTVAGFKRNVSVVFLNNTVEQQKINSSIGYCGHSIYTMSLQPCLYVCKQNAEARIPIKDVFTCVGKFIFNNGTMRKYEMSTSGARFVYTSNKSSFSMIPSKETLLPVYVEDDLNQMVKAEYHLTILNKGNSQIMADEAYTYLSESRTELYGNPQDSATILLSKTGLRGIAIKFKLHMEECPPGYVLILDPQFNLNLNRCVCSVNTNKSYGGIYNCNGEIFTASLQHGYWIGYIGGETEKHLFYAYCPNRYCFLKEERKRFHRLTDHASKVELDKRVCEDTRTGVLCGSCRDGYSALYHSSSALCSNTSDCRFGWLLYLMSELLPLTLMFIIIVAFDISFVSGEVNGFIFFAQVSDLLSITGNGFISFPKVAYLALKIIRSVYKFLNFDFFSVDELSFCLWKGATTLDMIVFKFVTVTYALLLIVLTIWLMNKCNIYQRLSCLHVNTVKSSVIHGLSAFLIMVYVQCAKVSFKLLDFTVIYAQGHIHNHTVVTYQGDLLYFESKHLPYAIPAIMCILVVVTIPVVILTLYPSCFKVISWFKMEETRCVSWIIQKVPYAFLKPFADSFQSCYKDNMRFFAGLYFTYRIVILIGLLAPSHLTQSYTLLELILVTILVIHAIAQPYSKKRHNILDTLIFFNLIIINSITLYNYNYAKYYKYDGHGIEVLIHIQLFFVYLPLVCFITHATFSLIRRGKSKSKRKALKAQLEDLIHSDFDDELPSRLENSEEISNETDYEMFEDQTK